MGRPPLKKTNRREGEGNNVVEMKPKANDSALNCYSTHFKIGTWARAAQHDQAIVIKIFFKKSLMAWEISMVEDGVKRKMETPFSNILVLKILNNDFHILLNAAPTFFIDKNKKSELHSVWDECKDFTGGQASFNRLYTFTCYSRKMKIFLTKIQAANSVLSYLFNPSFPLEEYLNPLQPPSGYGYNYEAVPGPSNCQQTLTGSDMQVDGYTVNHEICDYEGVPGPNNCQQTVTGFDGQFVGYTVPGPSSNVGPDHTQLLSAEQATFQNEYMTSNSMDPPLQGPSQSDGPSPTEVSEMQIDQTNNHCPQTVTRTDGQVDGYMANHEIDNCEAVPGPNNNVGLDHIQLLRAWQTTFPNEYMTGNYVDPPLQDQSQLLFNSSLATIVELPPAALPIEQDQSQLLFDCSGSDNDVLVTLSCEDSEPVSKPSLAGNETAINDKNRISSSKEDSEWDVQDHIGKIIAAQIRRLASLKNNCDSKL